MSSVPLPKPVFEMDLEGNHLRVVDAGADLLAGLLALIDGARHHLKLYFYIFDTDASARLVLARLIRAARRGVAVTLVIDAFGSGASPTAFFDGLVKAGGRFGWFGERRTTRYLIRNHQKIAIADDARLVIGGFNIADGYFGIPPEDCWRDLGLWIEGPQVEAMVSWYGQLWRWVSSRKQKFRTLRAMVRLWPVAHPPVRGSAFRWLIGGPTQRLSPWAQAVKHDLDRGRRLDMIEAYFSPGQGMLRRLGRLARRGEARLIMASKSDNGATVAAARLLYGPLLKRGAAIYEYRPCKLHTKLLVIDDAVYIGSANFDMRSLFLNLEVMLRIENADFAQAMRSYVSERIGESHAITPDVHDRRRGVMTFLTGWASYFLVGFLDYTVTRRLNFKDRPED